MDHDTNAEDLSPKTIARNGILYHPTLSGRERLVAACLIDRWNVEDDMCCPSLRRIAADTNMDRRFLMRILEKLCTGEDRIFDRAPGAQGRGRSAQYWPRLPVLAAIKRAYLERRDTPLEKVASSTPFNGASDHAEKATKHAEKGDKTRSEKATKHALKGGEETTRNLKETRKEKPEQKPVVDEVFLEGEELANHTIRKAAIAADIVWEKIGGDLTKEQRANATDIWHADPAYGETIKREAIKAERRQRGEGAKRLLHLAQHWQQPPAGETEDDSPLRH